MFGNIMENMKSKQAEMKARLAEEIVEAQVENGAITVKANANREILDIAIDKEKIDLSDLDQLQDLLVIAVNEAIAIAAEREAAEAEGMIKDLMPPGLGGLFG